MKQILTPEWKPKLPDVRMQLHGKKGKGEGDVGTGTDLLKFQQEQLARERLLGEREPVPFMELQVLGLLDNLEKAEGDRQEEGSVEWPLTIQLQGLVSRRASVRYPIKVLENYGRASKVTDKNLGDGNWYSGVPSSFGFESKIIVDASGNLREVVDLGNDDQNNEKNRGKLAERIKKFTRNVFARMEFSSLYGHLFKKNIEAISNLATLYLASVDVGREDLKALLTLPACPEDFGKELESMGGIKYETETALGHMIVSAWQIFNATGLSEKPRLYKDFVGGTGKAGWQKNVVAAGKEEIQEQWFGNPDNWTPGLATREEWYLSKDRNARWDGKTSKGERNTLEEEKAAGVRGELTKWGNIFVREESYANPVEYREKVIEFLGGSVTARKAVELAWRYFRMFGSADFVGYEWYAEYVKDPKTGQKTKDIVIHAAIPLGSDFTSDLGKIIRPDEYFEFYHKNARGGLPRGAYGKVRPFVVDVLRGIQFGDGYKLPDGRVLTDRASLYELLFIYGVPPENLDYDKLPERAIQSPYLRIFMAAKGAEFGMGSFDKTSAKIESPEPFLSPAFWEKLMSDFHVGITKENVAWRTFIRNNGAKPYKLPEEMEVRQYRLEGIKTILDAIFAEEITKKWDEKPENWGADFLGKLGVRGITKKGAVGKYIVQKIIDAANEAIPDLHYSIDRLEEVRKRFRMV